MAVDRQTLSISLPRTLVADLRAEAIQRRNVSLSQVIRRTLPGRRNRIQWSGGLSQWRERYTTEQWLCLKIAW